MSRDTILKRRAEIEQQKEREKDIKGTEKKWQTFNEHMKNKKGLGK